VSGNCGDISTTSTWLIGEIELPQEIQILGGGLHKWLIISTFRCINSPRGWKDQFMEDNSNCNGVKNAEKKGGKKKELVRDCFKKYNRRGVRYQYRVLIGYGTSFRIIPEKMMKGGNKKGEKKK